MTSRITSIAFGAERPESLAAFWCEVLGWQVVEHEVEEAGGEFISIGPGDAPFPTIDIMTVPERKTGRNRLHLDVRADGTTTEAELERLLALGARRTDVGQPADVSWVVLADPEGNEFCLLSRTVQEVLAEEGREQA